ncbi:MAG: hypothetical protein OXF85_02770 [Candidatus Saccharibacteria bacterium]|nr:hypothetical protein [Candidatus Saccharibacteria bacterium]MCY4089042.1 hypothetical protein [Candidatus Saccharibacteria bacterium]
MEFSPKPQFETPKPEFDLEDFLNHPKTLEKREAMALILTEIIGHRSGNLGLVSRNWSKFMAPNIYRRSFSDLRNYHQTLLDLHAQDLLYYPCRKQRQKLETDIKQPDKNLAEGIHSATILIFDILADYEASKLIPTLPLPKEIIQNLHDKINGLGNQKLRYYLSKQSIDSSYLRNQEIRANNIYKFSVEVFAERLKQIFPETD